MNLFTVVYAEDQLQYLTEVLERHTRSGIPLKDVHNVSSLLCAIQGAQPLEPPAPISHLGKVAVKEITPERVVLETAAVYHGAPNPLIPRDYSEDGPL